MFGVKSVVSPHRAEPETPSRLYAYWESTIRLLHQLKVSLHYLDRIEVSYQGLVLPCHLWLWYGRADNNAREGQTH